LQPGDQVELRGPIGGHFVWDTSMPGPLLLIGGGSGMVPLMSMLRHYANQHDEREVVLLISAKTLAHIPYQRELESFKQTHAHFHVSQTLTRQAPPNWSGFSRRIDTVMLEAIFRSYQKRLPMIYVCGSTEFVDIAANGMVSLGFPAHAIKTERFG